MLSMIRRLLAGLNLAVLAFSAPAADNSLLNASCGVSRDFSTGNGMVDKHAARQVVQACSRNGGIFDQIYQQQ
ncbi:MAG: hypothetical protein V5B32_00485 [Candidatus Accumulibacter sp. UW26]|jgi:hypothetical protein